MLAEPSAISILDQRRIEAQIIKPIYDSLKEEFGIEVAQRIIRDAIKKAAVDFGHELSDGAPSLRKFADLLPLWTRNGALEIEVKAETDATFEYNVVRCRYAEMYRELGLSEIGHLLSCNRDASFCEGYDPRLTLIRTQTIMEGSRFCDFRYQWSNNQASSPESGETGSKTSELEM